VEQPPDGPTVFLVEDDAVVRDSLVVLVEVEGFRVEAFSSAADFLASYDPTRPGCLVLDVRLPDMSGTELHERLLRAGIRLPTIFLTGHAPPEMSEESRSRGVVAVFEKPCPADDLVEAIRRGLAGA
jgi:two-component system response regulator FixJ